MDPILTAWGNDLSYLQNELRWVEVRAERLGLERRRDARPEDRPRRGGYEVQDQRIEPDLLAVRIEVALAAEQELREQIDARLAVHRSRASELALDRLVRVHGLDQTERTIVLLAAAPCVAHRFLRLFDALGSERASSVTIDSIFTFLGLSFSERVLRRRSFSTRGRLLSNDLISIGAPGYRPSPSDLLTTGVEVTSRTFAFLLGEVDGVGDELCDLVNVEEPRATLDQVVMPEEDRRRILSVVERHDLFLATRRAWGLDGVVKYGRGVIVLCTGAPGTGKTMTAHGIAHRLGKRVFNVNLVAFFAHEEAGTFVPALFREAKLANSLLLFDECELLFRSRHLGENPLLNILLTEIERFDGIAVLATNVAHVLDDALDRRILVRVNFASPSKEAREKIWRSLLPPTVPLAEDVDLGALAERHEMSGGSIKNTILVAAARAIHEADDATTAKITQAMFEAAARDQAEGRRLTRADHDRAEREELGSRAPRRRPAGFL